MYTRGFSRKQYSKYGSFYSEVAQPSEEDQQENLNSVATKSQESTKTNRKKKRTTPSKKTSKFNSEPIRTAISESKKMKKDILSMQEIKNVPEEFQARLKGLITQSDFITGLLDACMENKAEASTVQKGSEDNGSDSL